MVRLNGEKFKIYTLDTKNTILFRIAKILKTAPSYLVFEDKDIDFFKAKNIKVFDVISVIKKLKDVDFNKFLLENNINNPEEISKLWIVFNKEFEKLVSYNEIILTQYGQQFVNDGYFKTLDDFNQFWNNKENFKDQITSNIDMNLLEAEKYDELYEIFDNIDEGKVYTDLKVERVKLDIITNLKISLLEIFNSLILNESIPFATCKEYYKILKDFIPPDDWSKSSDETLLMKINDKVIVDKNKIKDYIDAVISIEDEKIKTVVKLISERGYLTKESFLQRFSEVFNGIGKIEFESIKELEVAGLFYFPELVLNMYVLSDLIMNNRIFYSIININESEKTTKRKGDGSQSWLYIYFNHPNTGIIGASIIQKVVDRSDPEMRNQNSNVFPHNSPYVRIRAKGRDKKSIIEFQKIFSKLLEIYDTKHNEIVEFYEKYIPNFGEIALPDIPLKRKEYEMVAPEVFVKNYSRTCPPERIPTIIDKDKSKQFKKNGFQVMKFPRDVQSTNSLNSDGINQHYYVCENKDYPFPGLRINNLANNEDYPYVPCCFKVDQNKKGGVFRHYYNGEELEIKEKKQQELIITNKILGNSKYGQLPPNLSKFFETIDSEDDYKYIRMGVYRNPSSFLNAVMTALHMETNILDYSNEDKRNKKLEEIRNILASKEICPLARQCAYTYTYKSLSEKLKNMDDYFDPKLFVQMLETYFKCTIFLFNDESLMLPRYTQNYYKNKSNNRCIFIYEHWGSESDHAKYPQCELIIKWHTQESTNQKIIFEDDKISKKISKIFKLINNSYSLDKHIDEIIFPLKIDIISQKIDSYGKTRCLECKLKDELLYILVDPIPPLAINEKKEMIVTGCNIKTALKIIEPLFQTIIDSKVMEIIGKIGNVNVIIPVKPSNPLENIPISNSGLHYIEGTASELSVFNKNKKMARYLVEYTFWMFSNFLNKIESKEITDEILSKFAKKNIVIDPNFEYTKIPKNFSLSSNILKNGKLVLPSEDGIKRLMYTLKLYSMRDTQTLINYYLKENIVNYYVDITDFDSFSNQVILQGEDSIEKWIQESRFVFKMFNNVAIGYNLPYFYMNEKIEDKVFLAQNTDSLTKALIIASTWEQKGYNPVSVKNEEGINYGFNLYTYGNNEMLKTIVKGKKQSNFNILGYTIKETPFYTVLLNLDF